MVQSNQNPLQAVAALSRTMSADLEGLTALYARLSKDDEQEGDSNSIVNQRDILVKYAASGGFANVRFYCDDGVSGTTFDRPGFNRMIHDIEKGIVRTVIVKDMSRFGRDYLKVGYYTDILFQEKDVRLIAVNDGVDSARGDNDFTPIRNLFNEFYARDTSKKIRAVFSAKVQSGETLTFNVPYGFIKDPDNPKHWLVDEEAAAVVRRMFELCMGGKGPEQIARQFQAEQILSPRLYTRKHRKGETPNHPNPYQWNSSFIATCLSRMEYIGHSVNGKSFKKSYKHGKRQVTPPDERVIVKNTHEAIVSEAVFNTVQNLRENKKRPNRSGEIALFSGLLYCADCGAKLYNHRKTGQKYDQECYYCSRYKRRGYECTSHHIRAVVLEKLVKEELRRIIGFVSKYEDHFAKMMMNSQQAEQLREADKKRKRLAAAQTRIAELDLLFKRIYEDNVKGKLSDSRFTVLSTEYEAEQAELLADARKLQEECFETDQQAASFEQFIQAVRKYTEFTELTPSLLRELIEKIVVHAADKSSGKRIMRIDIFYNFSIGTLELSDESGCPANIKSTCVKTA